VVRKEKKVCAFVCVCMCVCVCERACVCACVGKQLKGVSEGSDIPAVLSTNVIFLTQLVPINRHISIKKAQGSVLHFHQGREISVVETSGKTKGPTRLLSNGYRNKAIRAWSSIY